MILLTVLSVFWCAEGTVISIPLEDQVFVCLFVCLFVWDYFKWTPSFYCAIKNISWSNSGALYCYL